MRRTTADFSQPEPTMKIRNLEYHPSPAVQRHDAAWQAWVETAIATTAARIGPPHPVPAMVPMGAVQAFQNTHGQYIGHLCQCRGCGEWIDSDNAVHGFDMVWCSAICRRDDMR